MIARELYLAHSGFRDRVRPACPLHRARRSRPARRRISRRWRRPTGRPRSTRRSWMRCCAALGVEFLRRHDRQYRRDRCPPVAGSAATATSRSSSPDVSGWNAVAIRHTVGLDDKIEGEGGVADARENSGARYFKLKLNGDPEADAARLTRIGNELATLPHDYRVTLDANEQYADLAALGALIDRLDRDGALAADRGKTALHRAADAARHHAAIAARRARGARFHHRRGRRFLTMRSRRRARSAIAASRRNPARASTSRSSMRPAPPNGARAARNFSSPART